MCVRSATCSAQMIIPWPTQGWWGGGGAVGGVVGGVGQGMCAHAWRSPMPVRVMLEARGPWLGRLPLHCNPATPEHLT